MKLLKTHFLTYFEANMNDEYGNWGIQRNKPEGRGPHHDYERNLREAERFCFNVKKSLLAGMSVKIEDSHALKRALLMIAWQAPRHAPVGNYANGVFLHQSKTEYDREVEAVFNSYMKRAQKWNDWKPKAAEVVQLDPFLEALKA